MSAAVMIQRLSSILFASMLSHAITTCPSLPAQLFHLLSFVTIIAGHTSRLMPFILVGCLSEPVSILGTGPASG